MMQMRHFLALALCACTLGCVRFQTGPSEPVPRAERMSLPGRGVVRVIDMGPGHGAGAVETVLLVHGYGASSASWRPIVPRLAERFRVLVVDLPGFGQSDRREGDYSPAALADALAEILDRKGVARAHVVGHSWGSSVVLAFAERHRDKLDRLAILSGWIYDEQLLPMMRWARVPGLGELLFALFYPAAIGERMYLNFYDPTLVTQALVDEIERGLEREGAVATALAAARGMATFVEQEKGYPRIDAETLLLWGREDRVARPAFGERLARELPRARLVVLPRCGHIPMWECTGETVGALEAFLSGGGRP
jgi:pimeloyl-ACP methyl ester carboxylesterase